MFDVVTWGEVRSETGQKSLFRQRDDGFVLVESCGMRQGDFSIPGQLPSHGCGPEDPQTARPQHNSGLLVHPHSGMKERQARRLRDTRRKKSMRRENMNGKFSRREFVKLATVTVTTAGLSLSGSGGLAAAEQKVGAQGPATNGRGRGAA